MTPANAPIVLLHGWGFAAAVWAPLIEALLAVDVDRARILTPALPLSSKRSPQENVEALAGQLPAHAHLVGWSLGGEFALSLALSQPERFATLSMIASTPCFTNNAGWSFGQPSTLLDGYDQRLAANPSALLKRFAMLVRHGDAAASRNRALGDWLTAVFEPETDRLLSGLQCLRQLDLRTAAATLTVPTQLIHGAQDAVVPIAAADWLQQQTSAVLHRIDDASHALPLTHAGVIAPLLQSFVEAQA